MANPVKCVGCWKPTFQVRLIGNNLREETCQQVYDSLLNNNITGLKHVAKKTQQDSAFLHFESHLAASAFHNSNVTGSFIIDGVSVTVQPIILTSGERVRYSQRGLSFAPTPTTPEREATTPTSAPEREATTPTPENETWKINVKRAIVELRDKEKQHEEELARIKKNLIIGGKHWHG
ncbi:hypothetical protein INT45_009131 [Circinella minor]|uniref:Uncharacterized protein n=1 Tax=Circinella minor TaxID=1195481 RepID=A0A8H7SEF3_9FUNG|nr:hypothetical protein INT45_009131 [Circinella minor]